MASNVDQTLAERGTRYGDFAGHAKITQGLKKVFIESPKWNALADDQKEALEMVAHKIGRILNGDPDYADSWHDIAGYSKLVEDRLTEVQPQAELPFRQAAPSVPSVGTIVAPEAQPVQPSGGIHLPPLVSSSAGVNTPQPPASVPSGSILDGVKVAE